MASRAKDVKTELKATGNERYLHDVFNLVKRVENLTVTDKKTKFNDTEIRLIGEVYAAKFAGKRLISTQLAKLLGVTRSAISQIVNRLEEEGLVRRVPDLFDRKIAYIEVSEEAIAAYSEDMKIYVDFIGNIVEKFGAEKFDTMCGLVESFVTFVEKEKACFAKEHSIDDKE